MRTLNPGNLSKDNGWTYRIAMLQLTIVCIVITSTLIGIVNCGIENFQKGQSIIHKKIITYTDSRYYVVLSLRQDSNKIYPLNKAAAMMKNN